VVGAVALETAAAAAAAFFRRISLIPCGVACAVDKLEVWLLGDVAEGEI
jgi:hypothetical protein